MSLKIPKAGIFLWCNTHGVVTDVVQNEFGTSLRLKPGQPFPIAVDRGSLLKAQKFIQELQDHGFALDWEMNFTIDGQLMTLHLAGGAVKDRFFVMGARTSGDIAYLCEDLLRTNDKDSPFSVTLKTHLNSMLRQAHRDDSIYDEITRLNNELVTLQRELAKKNVELEKLNELKNRFLGIAAHDLRNPLNIIMNFSETLLYETTDILNEEHREFLDIIYTTSTLMAGLVNDLLDISTIEAGKLRLDLTFTDVEALVSKNIARNRVLARKKHIDLQLETEDLPMIMVDAPKIEQVLNNLISNAIKFSNPHTTITVRATKTETHVLIAVADQGPGIPADELDKLFKPFQRTTVQSTDGEKSTGLGLAIVKNIVRTHRGKIWVESELHKGSTFYITLPLEKG